MEKKTPVKVTSQLSPSGENFCILCCDNITDMSKKRKLWNENKSKTPACVELETCLQCAISPQTDFRCICKACRKSVHTLFLHVQEKQSLMEKSREFAKRFIREKTKRLSKFHQGSVAKKRLLYDSKATKQLSSVVDEKKCVKLTVTVENDLEKIIIPVPDAKQKYVQMAASSLPCHLLNYLLENNFNECEETFMRFCTKRARSEVISLTSNKCESLFRGTDVNNLKEISYMKMLDEIDRKAPFLCNVIRTMAINPRSDKRNKIKKGDVLIPPIVNAINALLMCRNRSFNTCAVINSLALRRGNADKVTLTRMHALNQSLSYNAVLCKLSDIGKNFRDPVMKWKSSLDHDKNIFIDAFDCMQENPDAEMKICVGDTGSLDISCLDESFLDVAAFKPDIKEVIDFSMLDDSISNTDEEASNSDVNSDDDLSRVFADECNLAVCTAKEKNSTRIQEHATERLSAPDFFQKFMVVGDNVDFQIKRRHMTLTRQNIDMHLFNLIAVRNRVSPPKDFIGLSRSPIKKLEDVDLRKYFPSASEEENLKTEFKFLVATDLMAYIEEVDWFKKFLPVIPHKYNEEASEKSEILPLGILNKNESTSEGIIDIMKDTHTLVPGNGTNRLLRIFSVGDLLTCEREQNAQTHIQDGDDPSTRLEGLIPAIADFHTMGNFMEVIWHILYNNLSGAEIGTLFQARNFLNARSVPNNPMKDVNACEELLSKYTEALIITAFRHHCEDKKMDFRNIPEDQRTETLFNQILNDIVVKYVFPETPDVAGSNSFDCSFCHMKYKTMKGLINHNKSEHKHNYCSSSSTKTSDEDFILNYSRNALSLGYLLKDFIYARKTANGEQLIRLYKYLLFYFKIDHRTKYAFQSLHLLAQVNDILPPSLSHELVWNRSVNNKGKFDSNVELDRELEHRNKYAKLDLRQLHGTVTEKAIDRISKSCDAVQKILNNFDNECSLEKASGRHAVADWKNDVMELADQYDNEQLLKFQRGRFHQHFPSFPKNYLHQIDIRKFKLWSQDRILKFAKMNIYKHPKEVITV